MLPVHRLILVLLTFVVLTAVAAAPLHADDVDRYTCATARDPELEDHDAAIAACDALIARNADDAMAHLDRGYGKLAGGDAEGASADAERSIQFRPDWADGYALRGKARWDLRNNDGAYADLSRAVELEPQASKRWSDRADLLVSLNRHEEAIADYRKAIALSPNAAELHTALAHTFDSLKRLDEASAEYDKAIAVATDKSHYYLRKSRFLASNKRRDAAVAVLNDAIALLPSPTDLLTERARLATADKRDQDALADYGQIIAIDKGTGLALRADFYENHDQLDLALADRNELVAMTPDRVPTRFSRARLHRKAKNYDLALADINACLEATPDATWLIKERIAINTARGSDGVEATLADHAKLIELNPDTGAWYTERAKFLRSVQRLEEALADDDKAVAKDEKNAYAYASRADSNWQLSRLDAVIADIDKAIALEPDDPRLQYFKAWYVDRATGGRAEDMLFALVPAADVAKTASLRDSVRRANDTNSVKALDDARRQLRDVDEVAAVGMRAVRHEIAGDIKLAVEDCDTLVALAPNDARPYAMRARLRDKAGDAGGAIDDMAKAVSLQPQATWLHLQRAQVHERWPMTAGEPRSTYDKLVAMHPENSWILNKRAKFLHKSKLHDEALTDYTTSLSLYESIDTYQARVALLMEMGRYAAAADDFSKMIALEPDTIALYGGRGYANLLGRRLPQAAYDYSVLLLLILKAAYLPE